jgi:hypothetical protein
MLCTTLCRTHLPATMMTNARLIPESFHNGCLRYHQHSGTAPLYIYSPVSRTHAEDKSKGTTEDYGHLESDAV